MSAARSARPPRRLTASAAATLLTTVWLLISPGAASASHRQVTMFADTARLLSDPAGTLATMRSLGATTIRVVIHWELIAPDPTARKIPAGFNGLDPAAYAAANWAPYDTIVRDAQADSVSVDFTLAGGAPRWAQGAGIPPQGIADLSFAWKPSASRYGDFVHAVGERYNGTYVPPGQSTRLPAVRFWDVWNEPNFGQDLGPQAIDGSTVSVAPMAYRRLVDSAWKALHRTGHAHDTIVIGGFAAEGRSLGATKRFPQGLPGDYAQTKPLQFIRTLYCVGANDRPLRGTIARAEGCPSNGAGTRAFRRRHPGLFSAGGVADHPYSGERSPVDASALDPDFAIFAQLGNLERVLDGAQRAYGSRRRYVIYNDEYGYITNPPHGAGYVSPATAADYLNWSEYLSWKSARIASYAQYLLQDPPPGDSVGFASGLEFLNGKPKADYAAFRLPLYMPVTSAPAGRRLEVWGNARPAHFMAVDGNGPETVAIQLQAGGRGSFSTVKTITLAGTDSYFDTRVAFADSGNVRLAYTYPSSDPFLPTGVAGTTVTSRLVKLAG